MEPQYTSKRCTLCQQSKSLDCFWRHKRSRDGHISRCKECQGEEYQRNKAKYAERNKRWRDANVDRFRAMVYAWREANPERTRAIYLRDYARNKARHLAYWATRREGHRVHERKYRQRHPDVIKARNHLRRARELGCEGRYTAAEWRELCARFDYRCAACGKSGRLTVDHIVPIVHGGRNDIENIQPLCQSCNSRKGARTIRY